MSKEEYCHRYDTCWFTQKKNFYSGVESDRLQASCMNKGIDCYAAKLSDIEFKMLEREKGENIWKKD